MTTRHTVDLSTFLGTSLQNGLWDWMNRNNAGVLTEWIFKVSLYQL